jgi:hypothetical protein
MRKILKKLGLIKDFEIQFHVDSDKVIESLISDKNDVKISPYSKVFGKHVPFNSTDFKYDRIKSEFSSNRESDMNIHKGRAKIKFKIEPFENNKTIIKGELKSHYTDFKYVLLVYCVLMSVLTILIVLNENFGFALILYITGFFSFVTTFIIAFQRFELYKVQKALINYLKKRVTKANSGLI